MRGGACERKITSAIECGARSERAAKLVRATLTDKSLRSFGMTAWEIFSGDVPYEGFKPSQLLKTVCVKQERPSTEGFEIGTKKLLEACWAHEPDDRSTFEEVKEVRPAGERSERTK